jgi:hypothetical protein
LHGRSHGQRPEDGEGSEMGRQFGAIRRLPSGNFQASYIAPGIGRVTAPITFARYDQPDTWLPAQRVDLARETWKAPSVGSTPCGSTRFRGYHSARGSSRARLICTSAC